MTKISDIIKNSKFYNYIYIPIYGDDDFPPIGIPGGGSIGNGGSTSGVTTGVIVSGITLSPSGNQSVAIGVRTCFTASGAISLPAESNRVAVIDVGCYQTSSGVWVKTCGTNGGFDAECLNSKLLHPKQPFHIQGSNTVFTGGTPGSPTNNVAIIIGVKSTGGYRYFWEVYKYCNATPGDCSSRWKASANVINPDGSRVIIGSGFVEFNQTFRVKSDGTRIIWEYTTEQNWVYNYASVSIPIDTGSFQFFVNGGWTDNTWTNLTTYRGSYQATIQPDEFVWSTNCPSNLEVDGETACFVSTTPGSCDICVSGLGLDPVCTTIISSPLYLNPIDYDCGSCGGPTQCLNIPDPTEPVITTTYIDDSITITWSDSISFTTGLYYQVDVNGTITDVLDSTLVLTGLADDTYVIKVRAIDDCGQSDFSNIETVIINTGFIAPATPSNFLLTKNPGSPSTYTASWDTTIGAVDYEIFIGNPQSTFLISTASTSIFLGQLINGLSLSVRAKDGSNLYSPFSNIEIVN